MAYARWPSRSSPDASTVTPEAVPRATIPPPRNTPSASGESGSRPDPAIGRFAAGDLVIGFIAGSGSARRVEVVRHTVRTAVTHGSSDSSPGAQRQPYAPSQAGRRPDAARSAWPTPPTAGPDPADLRSELGDLRSCRVGESPAPPPRDAPSTRTEPARPSYRATSVPRGGCASRIRAGSAPELSATSPHVACRAAGCPARPSTRRSPRGRASAPRSCALRGPSPTPRRDKDRHIDESDLAHHVGIASNHPPCRNAAVQAARSIRRVTSWQVPRGRATTSAATTRPSTELKRVMGPWLLLLFIVGDILGTGVYALTGQVAERGRRRGWLPFLVAFVVATDHGVQLSRAGDEVPAGGRRRALHAQGVRHPLHHLHRRLHGDVLGHHLGVDRLARVRREPRRRASISTSATSASSCHRAGLHGADRRGQLPRRRRERQGQRRADLVELSGLLLVILVGLLGDLRRRRATSRAPSSSTRPRTRASSGGDAATSLAFFAMVGFEDSVNMAEETKDPVRIFPKMMLTGLVDHRRHLRAGRPSPRSPWFRSDELGRERDAAGEGRARPARPGCRSSIFCRSSRCSRSPTRR